MLLAEFLNTHDPFFGFRWRIKSFPIGGFDLKYVEKVTVPWATYESIPIYGQGYNRYYHSVHDIDAINITFYEDAELTVSKMLVGWRKLIQEDGYYGLPVYYKKDIEIELLANNSDVGIAVFTGYGAWPSAIEGMNLAYDSSERVQITATFTIDSGKLEFVDFESGVSSRASAYEANNSPLDRASSDSSSNIPSLDEILGGGLPNSVNNSSGGIPSESPNSTNDNGWSISTNSRTMVNPRSNPTPTTPPGGYPFDPNFPDYGINNPNKGRFPQYPIDPNFPDYSGNTKAPGGSDYVEYDPNFPDYYPWQNGQGQQIEYDPNFPDYTRPKVAPSGLFSFSGKAKTISNGKVIIQWPDGTTTENTVNENAYKDETK